MMSLTFGLFTQVSGSGPLGPLVIFLDGSRGGATIHRQKTRSRAKVLHSIYKNIVPMFSYCAKY